MNIHILTIPHSGQRYNTVGDWWWEKDDLHIRVSHLASRHSEVLVAIHELVEAVLCKSHGLSERVVDQFDVSYTSQGEPGDSPDCPYYWEHHTATVVEQLVCLQMGVNWEGYCREVDSAGGPLPAA